MKKKRILIIALLIILLAICIFSITKYSSNKLNQKQGKILQIEAPYINYPPVPEGFVYKEGTVETGYVIQDANENEFVWIPIDELNIIQTRKDFGTSDTLISQTSETIPDEMQTSINTYKGYWIGKYEANSEGISKKGGIPITGITNEEAKNTCNSYNAGAQAVGHLIYGQEWDMAIQFIETTNQGYSTDTNSGNYGTTIVKTGESSDIKNNIYDLARKCKRMDNGGKNKQYGRNNKRRKLQQLIISRLQK